MGTYLVRRLLLIVPILLGVTILTFFIANLVPADPARLQAGPNASAEVVQRIREKLGLDDPLPVQYLRYVSNLLHGNLGTSIRTQRPVLEDLGIRFLATFELTITALSLSIIGGILIGTLAAVKRGGFLDQGSRLFALSGVAVPSFWLGILLQLLLFFKLGLLPSSGRIGQFITLHHITGLYLLDSLLTGNWVALKSSFLHLLMPAATLSLYTLALVSRTVRSSMLDVILLDYVQTARSKGLSERVVILKHALRNALIPVVTMSGMTLASLLGGAILVETVFTWPGMGLYVVHSVFAMDFPAILGFTILIAVIVQLMNLLVDVSYPFFDPRIRFD